MTATTLEKALLLAASDDWVYFAEVVSIMREEGHAVDEAGARERAISIVEDLAQRGLWRAGDLTTEGFLAWSVTPEYASHRMRAELRTIERPVYPGDICWFEITEEGLATLKRHEETA